MSSAFPTHRSEVQAIASRRILDMRESINERLLRGEFSMQLLIACSGSNLSAAVLPRDVASETIQCCLSVLSILPRCRRGHCTHLWFSSYNFPILSRFFLLQSNRTIELSLDSVVYWYIVLRLGKFVYEWSLGYCVLRVMLNVLMLKVWCLTCHVKRAMLNVLSC